MQGLHETIAWRLGDFRGDTVAQPIHLRALIINLGFSEVNPVARKGNKIAVLNLGHKPPFPLLRLTQH